MSFLWSHRNKNKFIFPLGFTMEEKLKSSHLMPPRHQKPGGQWNMPFKFRKKIIFLLEVMLIRFIQ